MSKDDTACTRPDEAELDATRSLNLEDICNDHEPAKALSKRLHFAERDKFEPAK